MKKIFNKSLRKSLIALAAVCGYFLMGHSAHAAAAAKPAQRSPFNDSILAWKNRVVAKKGNQSFFISFGHAMNLDGAKAGVAMKELANKCQAAKDLVCLAHVYLVLDSDAGMEQALRTWGKPSIPELKLPMALIQMRVADKYLESDPKKAEQFLSAAAAVLNGKTYPGHAGDIAASRAMAAYFANNSKQGDQFINQAKGWYGRIGRSVSAMVLEMAGRSALRREDLVVAEKRMAEAISGWKNEGGKMEQIRATGVLASIYSVKGKYAEAHKLIDQAQALLKTVPKPPPGAYPDLLARKGRVFLRQKQATKARELLTQARQLFMKNGLQEEAAEILFQLANDRYDAGDMPTAANDLMALVRESTLAANMVIIRLRLAMAMADTKRCDGALFHADKATDLQKTDKNIDIETIMMIRVVKGRCLKETGKKDEAAKELGEVLKLARMLKLDKVVGKAELYAKGLKLPADSMPFDLSKLQQSLSGSMPLSGSPVLSGSNPLSFSALLSGSNSLSASPVISPSAGVVPKQLSP